MMYLSETIPRLVQSSTNTGAGNFGLIWGRIPRMELRTRRNESGGAENVSETKDTESNRRKDQSDGRSTWRADRFSRLRQ